MNNEARHVEELLNFPFETFQQFKNAYEERGIIIRLNYTSAREWAISGVYTSKSLYLQMNFLIWLPWIAIISFAIGVIIIGKWSMLFAVPVLFITYFLFYMFPGVFSMCIAVGTLILSLINGNLTWIFLGIALTAIWYAQSNINKIPIKHLSNAVSEHEDLLCVLWNSGVLSVQFFNGDWYFVDRKYKNEQIINY